MIQYTINEEGQTIEELFRDVWRLGKKQVHELRMAKAVTDEKGELLQWKAALSKGTIIQIKADVPNSSYIATQLKQVKVQYEDDHCLIVSKPKGMATHPNKSTDADTCMNEVLGYIKSNGGRYAEHVHRLDQGTKGLLLVAKHPIAKSIFDRMIEEKTVIRTYEAVVQGRVRQLEGTINEPIGKDRHHNTRRIVSKNGQHAVTHYKVIEHLKDSTVVHVVLETGRTHQIRVHMAHLGHPIVGDTLYNARTSITGDYDLHAIQLEFMHPFLNKQIKVTDQ